MAKHGVESQVASWPDETIGLNSYTLMKEGKIDFVNNITRGLSNGGLFNDYTIRCSAIDLNIPLITNTRLASAFITAFSKIGIDDLEIKSMDEYL